MITLIIGILGEVSQTKTTRKSLYMFPSFKSGENMRYAIVRIICIKVLILYFCLTWMVVEDETL